jgi:HSP20 family molecular chaperone IbpA
MADDQTVSQDLFGVAPDAITGVDVTLAPVDDDEHACEVTLSYDRAADADPADQVSGRLGAVQQALGDDVTFTHRLEDPVTLQGATATLDATDEKTTIRLAMHVADAVDGATGLSFVARDGTLARHGTHGPPDPPGDDPTFGSAEGLLASLRERWFWFTSSEAVTLDDDALVFTVDWPDAADVSADVRVERNALLVYVLGETLTPDTHDVAELSRRVDPPFPVDATAATASVADGRLTVRLPRVDPEDRADGPIAVET